jgi:hypothetical protein
MPSAIYRGHVSVVRGSARRRWSIAIGGVAALCLLPAVLAALPAPRASADPGELRARILASPDRPYEGYVESQGGLRVPDLPELRDVVALLGGSARIRTWYASPASWRVALIDLTGERDLYQTARGVYLWDFERNLTLNVVGDVSTRPPWASDAVPPELARRLLRSATPRDRVEAIASRRVAGVTAVGLRVTSADPETTIGRVDVWADPETGLPVQVEIAGRGAGRPVFVSRFLELRQRRPDTKVLTPADTGQGRTVNTGLALGLALDRLAPVTLPETLAGQRRAGTVGASGSGVSVYGEGWSRFVVLAVRGRVGSRLLRAAQSAGGVPLAVGKGEAVQLGAAVLSAVVVRSDDGLTRRTYLAAGFVSPDRLRRVGTDLLSSAR